METIARVGDIHHRIGDRLRCRHKPGCDVSRLHADSGGRLDRLGSENAGEGANEEHDKNADVRESLHQNHLRAQIPRARVAFLLWPINGGDGPGQAVRLREAAAPGAGPSTV